MIRGVFFSISSSCAFAALYYYTTLLTPLDGQEIFGLRMLLTLPCLTLLMVIGKEWKNVVCLAERIQRRPSLVLGLLASSALIGVQQWLFLWAPLNGKALNVSLGYFLLPLTMVLVGKLLYGEHISVYKMLAVAAALVGVSNQLYQVGGLAWETLLVALGFPLYFVLRRKLNTAHLGGLWFDMLLMLPVAAWFGVVQGEPQLAFTAKPLLFVLIPVLALVSASAFMAYIVASKFLPFGLFGLLGYIEPALMVLVSVTLGEKITASEWMTYLPIWIALGLLAMEGFRFVAKPNKSLPT